MRSTEETTDKSNALIESYNKKDIDEFTRLLKSGANPNLFYSEEFGDSLLHRACRDDNLNVVTAILKYSRYPVDLEKLNNESPPKTALQIAENNCVRTESAYYGLYRSQSINKTAQEIVSHLSRYVSEYEKKNQKHLARSQYQSTYFSRAHIDSIEAQSTSVRKREFKEDRSYPILTKEEVDGCTHAQLLVLEGESELLQTWLERMPHEVNAICEADSKDGIGKRSLIELALFDNKDQDQEEKIKILKIILRHRPHILDKHLPIHDLITIRKQEGNEAPNEQLYSIYESYYDAQKTCLADALKDLTQFMDVLNRLNEELSNSRLKLIVSELKDAIDTCDLVSRGYLKGDYDPLAKELRRRFNTNSVAYSSYSEELISKACASLEICMKLNSKPAGQQMSSSKQLSQSNDDLKSLSNKFGDMVDIISRILTRWGKIAITKGFNEYQRAEIERYTRHQRVMDFQEGSHPLRRSK